MFDGDQAASLQASLCGLAGVLVEGWPVEQTLSAVAQFAVTAIPGADGVGLTMLDVGGPDVMVASTDFVRQVDAVQYRLGEGPCVEAVATQQTQVCGSLGEQLRWSAFGPPAARMGVHSVLSLPLIVSGQTVGSLNVYGREHDAFCLDAVAVGVRFSMPAAVAVARLRVLGRTRVLAEQLDKALTTPAVIDHAIGILMSRAGCSAEEAFERLRKVSQAENMKVTEVSDALVQQAVRHARGPR